MPNTIVNRARIEEVAQAFDKRVPKPPKAGTLLVATSRGTYEAVRVMRFDNGDEVLFDNDEYVVFAR